MVDSITTIATSTSDVTLMGASKYLTHSTELDYDMDMDHLI